MNESIDPIRVAPPSPSITSETDSISSPSAEPARMKVEIVIPIKTVFKLLAVAALVCLLYLLGPIIVTLFLSTMIAVTLYPLLRKLQSSRLPDWCGIFIIISAIILCTGLIFTLILPPLIEQGTLLMTHIPALRESLLAQLPQTGPFRTMTTNALSELEKIDATTIVTPLMSIGQIALSGFFEIFLVLVFAIYLLLDGPRAVDWVLAFFSEVPRNKLRKTATETSKVISAFVGGQMIICIICGTYTLIVLSILNVPAALMLATIAGIFDILPVLGFFLAAGPAIILALTISPLTGVLVAGAYILYHAIENYFLIPRIYGNRLRLSDLVVLVSLIAAGTLGGIVGAIMILPLVASYPIVERIWLAEYLGKGVVRRHSPKVDSRPGAAKATDEVIVQAPRFT